MVILNAFQGILSIVFMISLGYYLTHKNWFDENSSKLLAKLVTQISVPAFMISNLMSNFDREKLRSSGTGLIVPILSIFITYIISIIVFKLLRIKTERRGVFQAMFFVSNALFIGLPVNLSLFGEISVPYVLLYYIANSMFFWTIGVFGIGLDGLTGKKSLFSIEALKKIFSPPLIGFMVGILFIFLQVKLPGFIMDTCKYLGNLTTPLSMLFIGITLYSIDFKKIRPSIDMAAILIGRFVLSPLLVLALISFIPIPELMKKVFVIQAAMPVMTNTAIIAKAYNADYEYASVMIAVTTIASMFFIPLYMALLQ